MSITTKTGDAGQTSLFSGERLWKDELRVEAYGSLDELDSFLGDARHLVTDAVLQDILREVQETLYRVMGQLAAAEAPFPYPLTGQEVDALTQQIRSLEEKTPLQGFVIPGSLPASARLDVCRAVTRRAERRLVRLARAETVAPELLHYVNRLSDLLFIMARAIEAAAGALRYVPPPGR